MGSRSRTCSEWPRGPVMDHGPGVGDLWSREHRTLQTVKTGPQDVWLVEAWICVTLRTLNLKDDNEET